MSKAIKIKVKKEFDVKDWIVSTLRRASYKTPQYSQASIVAKVPVPKDYPNKRIKFLRKCTICLLDHPLKETQIDHVKPVVPVTGWTKLENGKWDFNPIIYNMLEGELQLLCKPCHNKKSKRENAIRRLLNKMMELIEAKQLDENVWYETLNKDLYPALGLNRKELPSFVIPEEKDRPKRKSKRKVNK